MSLVSCVVTLPTGHDGTYPDPLACHPRNIPNYSGRYTVKDGDLIFLGWSDQSGTYPCGTPCNHVTRRDTM